MAIHPPAPVSHPRALGPGAFTLVDTSTLCPRGPWSPPPQGLWTYEDYARLPVDGRQYEVIEGRLYMAPAPDIGHQRAVGRLLLAISATIDRQGEGEVLVAPTDLLLPGRVGSVQPDLVYISAEREHIVAVANIVGAPDLVVEVLSPFNSIHDRQLKRRIYAEAGIPEYWIVDPSARRVEVYRLAGQVYGEPARFAGSEAVVSWVLPGLMLQVDTLFRSARSADSTDNHPSA